MEIAELAERMKSGASAISVSGVKSIALLFGLSTQFKENTARNVIAGALTGITMQAMTMPAAANTAIPYVRQNKNTQEIEHQIGKITKFPMSLVLTEKHLAIGTNFTGDIDNIRDILTASPKYLITMINPNSIQIAKKGAE